MTEGWLGAPLPAAQGEPLEFDTSVAHIARVYDYWLGGKDNFAADRAAGDEALQAYPDLVSSVRANRAFLARGVNYLAQAGIRQFLDIGTGIPSANNTHEVAQRVAPGSRVVYVDNDHSKSGCAHTNALDPVELPEANTGALRVRGTESTGSPTVCRWATWAWPASGPTRVMEPPSR